VALGIWDFTAEAFAKCIGQIFEMHPPEGEAVGLQLVKAVSFGHRPPLVPGIPQRQDSFSLVFRSADGRVLEPSLYKMVHPEFEAIEMSAERIQPPPGDPPGVYYEAVFN
jgi:hypothetical protein